MRTHIDECLESALSRRQSLVTDPMLDAYRVFNGRADGIAGLVIEKLADVLTVQLHEGRLVHSADEIRPAVQQLAARLGARAAYRKVFVRDRAPVPGDLSGAHVDATPWIGEPVEPERVVREHDLRFIIRPYDGFAVGLFLEHRDNRQRVARLAAGRRVLNAFSYTCSFSAAAAAGGAVSVSSLDLSARCLEWGKRNFALNGIDLHGHLFFRSDIFEFYRRAARQHRRYDLIILDPPSFSRSRRPHRVFVLQDELEHLCAGAAALLDPGGIVLLCTNHRYISLGQLEAALSAVYPARSHTILDRPALPIDFTGDPDYAKTVIARFD